MIATIPSWAWDAFPWVIEAIGIVIVIVWTVIPIREFIDIYRRLFTGPPAEVRTPKHAPAEPEEAAV